jgi:predicted DNA-binding mobile mystery protein A
MKTSRIKELDKELEHFSWARNLQTPAEGWIRHIRNVLNMSMDQLGNRTGKSRQAIKKIEDSERHGSISLSLLRETGYALGMELIYGFHPVHDSVEAYIRERSRILANVIMRRACQSMILENKDLTFFTMEKAIQPLSTEFRSEIPKTLWEFE